MMTITILKKPHTNKRLVAIPLEEYEELIALRKAKEFTPTPAQKKALARAEKSFHKGKTLSYDELARELEITS